MIGPDLRVRWAYQAPTPLEIPGANLIFDALEQAPDLGSAPVPPPAADDHVRGEGPLVVEYADLECPYCAKAHVLIRDLPRAARVPPLPGCLQAPPRAGARPRGRGGRAAGPLLGAARPL